MGRATGGNTLRIITIILLLIILKQLTVLVGSIKDIGIQDQIVQQIPEIPGAPNVEIMSSGGYLTVAGNAPGFSMAVLTADGQEKSVCKIKEGNFSFTFKPEPRDRTLQVQVFGDRMPTLYSRAISAPDIQTAEIRKPASRVPVRKTRTPVVKKPVVSTTKISDTNNLPEIPPELLTDINRGDSDSLKVAITFDGGSFNGSAERILEVLDERKLKATFFLTGEFMNRYQEVTKSINEKGHEVGNHTYSHLHLTTYEGNLKHDTLPGINREILLAELNRNEKLFKNITGTSMVKLWRAPYGEQNNEIRRWAASAGYQHVSWTFDPKTRRNLDGLDWVSDRSSNLYLTSAQIVEKIMSFDVKTDKGLGGGIVLLHLGTERIKDPFHLKLGQLIDEIQDKGYEIGSVSEMMGGPGGG